MKGHESHSSLKFSGFLNLTAAAFHFCYTCDDTTTFNIQQEVSFVWWVKKKPTPCPQKDKTCHWSQEEQVTAATEQTHLLSLGMFKGIKQESYFKTLRLIWKSDYFYFSKRVIYCRLALFLGFPSSNV